MGPSREIRQLANTTNPHISAKQLVRAIVDILFLLCKDLNS